MQVTISAVGQYVLTAGEVMQALGIPAGASLTSVVYDSETQTVTFFASELTSQTGTP